MQFVCLYQSVFLPTGVQWPSAWSHGVPPAAGENHWHPPVSTPALSKAAGLLLLCLPWGRSQPIWAQFGVSGYHSTVDTLGWINFAITVLGEQPCNCSVLSLWLHVFSFAHIPTLSALLLILSTSRFLAPDSPLLRVVFSVYLHRITFPFLSDRNPLWTQLNVT